MFYTQRLLATLQREHVGDQVVDLLLSEDVTVALRVNAFLIAAGEVGVGVDNGPAQIVLSRHVLDCRSGAIADVGEVRAGPGLLARLGRMAADACGHLAGGNWRFAVEELFAARCITSSTGSTSCEQRKGRGKRDPEPVGAHRMKAVLPDEHTVLVPIFRYP